MALLPGIYQRDFEDRVFVVNHHPQVRGSDVVLDPATRSPLHPTYRVLAGTVVVRQAQAATFLDADDPRGERNQPAEARSVQPPDAAWANTIVTVGPASGLATRVPLDPAATTVAAVVDQLNHYPDFWVHYLADDQGGLVRVRTREAGAHTTLHVESTLPAAFGPLGAQGHGLDADYRVTDAAVEVRDLDGNPTEALVPTLVVGHFLERQLLHLTPEARAVLSRRGSLFRR